MTEGSFSFEVIFPVPVGNTALVTLTEPDQTVKKYSHLATEPGVVGEILLYEGPREWSPKERQWPDGLVMMTPAFNPPMGGARRIIGFLPDSSKYLSEWKLKHRA